MELLNDAVDRVFREMPREALFGEVDAKVIQRYSGELLALRDKLVKVFYDTLFSHEATAAIFKPGERPEREKTLADWWVRTISGPFNREYWLWQAYVGVVHFKRGVTNAMMLSMWAVILSLIERELSNKLSREELVELMGSLYRLAATCSALTVEGYYLALRDAIKDAVGVDDDLMRNITSLMSEIIVSKISRPMI